MYQENEREMRAFREYVRRWYRRYGRHDLPWRQSSDPYRILVSECMLQQTQVARVLPKYEQFLVLFPDPQSLAEASVSDVVRAWQGLGYNRRALALKRAAEVLVREHGNVFPRNVGVLESLPGIGPYTARAVMVFAYNEPQVLIETNVRTVVYEHFFPAYEVVDERELEVVLRSVLPRRRVREWYWALMDYGSALKRRGVKRNTQNPQYRRQSPFKGSDREVRGAVLRELARRARTKRDVLYTLDFPQARVELQLEALICEGLVVCSEQTCGLPR